MRYNRIRANRFHRGIARKSTVCGEREPLSQVVSGHPMQVGAQAAYVEAARENSGPETQTEFCRPAGVFTGRSAEIVQPGLEEQWTDACVVPWKRSGNARAFFTEQFALRACLKTREPAVKEIESARFRTSPR